MQIYNKKAVTQNKLQHYKQINYINTPKKLQEKNRWVCHQNKIPINPHNGKNASCSDPTTWGNFQTAVEATNKYDFDGIGFQLGDGIVGIDLDNCFDEYGNLSYEARDIVDEANSYTEYSPSLRGLHIICEGNIPDGARKNTQKGFEIYSVGRYFTVTGNIFEKKNKIRMATKEMKEIYKKYFEKKNLSVSEILTSDFKKNFLEDEIFKKMLDSKNSLKIKKLWQGDISGYNSHSEADLALCSELAFWYGKDKSTVDNLFRKSGLIRDKWDEKHGSFTYGQITINKAIANTSDEYDSNYNKSINTPENSSQKDQLDFNLICMNDVEQHDVKWLWKPYIPLGKITILQGDPGLGKTFLALKIATIVSTGGVFPTDDNKFVDPSNIIFQTAEDGLSDTIKKRLVDSEADCKRIFVIDESKSTLTLNDKRLWEAIKHIEAKLVIIDPIQAYLGPKTDMHRANEIRPIMSKLGRMAEETGCAVVIIGHMNKATGMKSVHRGLGSIDIAASARSVLLVGEAPNNKHHRAVVQIKSSLAPTGKSIVFKLDPDCGFKWAGTSYLTADDILNYHVRKDREAPVRAEAEEFLKDILKDGKVKSKEIEAEAQKHNISKKTLRNAKEKLGVVSKKGEYPDSAWYWQLAPSHTQGQDGHLDNHPFQGNQDDYLDPIEIQGQLDEAEENFDISEFAI